MPVWILRFGACPFRTRRRPLLLVDQIGVRREKRRYLGLDRRHQHLPDPLS
jgi:hypothetical protein